MTHAWNNPHNFLSSFLTRAKLNIPKRESMNRTLLVANLLFFLASQVVSSQEPAFLSMRQGVRYEEARGSFHYVLPCRMPTAAAVQPDATTTGALCWPALLGRLQMIDGKLQSLTPVDGMFMLSASLLRGGNPGSGFR